MSSSSRARSLESVHRIHNVLSIHVLLDAVVVESLAHCFRLWWINLAAVELLHLAFGKIQGFKKCFVEDILDPYRMLRLDLSHANIFSSRRKSKSA